MSLMANGPIRWARGSNISCGSNLIDNQPVGIYLYRQASACKIC